MPTIDLVTPAEVTDALVVDDSGAMRSVLRQRLGALGLRSTCVGAAWQAIRWLAAAEGLPAVVLLDLNLPGVNGLQLLPGLRRLLAAAPTRILVVSCETSPSSISAALAAGADEYLCKPFTVEDLAAKLRLLEVAVAPSVVDLRGQQIILPGPLPSLRFLDATSAPPSVR